jgi:hypothetical protein
MLAKEYRLSEINFTKEAQKEINSAFGLYSAYLIKYNITLSVEANEELLKLVPNNSLLDIVSFKKSVNTLYCDNAKLRYAYEFNTLLEIIAIAERLSEAAEALYIRVDAELSKMFVRDMIVSNFIPFNEFKSIYLGVLKKVSVKDFETIGYEQFFIETCVRWLLFKTNLKYNSKDILQLRGFEQIEENVFKRISEKLISRFVKKRFDLLMPEDKGSIKQMLSRSEELGKKMKLEPYQFILFEASLKSISPNTYMQGVKFKFPEIKGPEYKAISKYVIQNYDIQMKLFPEQVTVILPICIAILKAEIPATVFIAK